MTLLITVFAAAVSTIVWYNLTDRGMKIGTLALMYWGASLMWFVDACAEYIEIKEEFFNPGIEDMINDTYLGFCAVAFGLIIWIVIVLIKDPKGKIRELLVNKK